MTEKKKKRVYKKEYKFSCPKVKCDDVMMSPNYLHCLDFIQFHKEKKPRHTKIRIESRMASDWEQESEW